MIDPAICKALVLLAKRFVMFIPGIVQGVDVVFTVVFVVVVQGIVMLREGIVQGNVQAEVVDVVGAGVADVIGAVVVLVLGSQNSQADGFVAVVVVVVV